MTLSVIEPYHSSGANCEVTIVEHLPSRDERILNSAAAVASLIGVVKKSSNTNRSVLASSAVSASR